MKSEERASGAFQSAGKVDQWGYFPRLLTGRDFFIHASLFCIHAPSSFSFSFVKENKLLFLIYFVEFIYLFIYLCKFT
jgi:hypothetical protein